VIKQRRLGTVYRANGLNRLREVGGGGGGASYGPTLRRHVFIYVTNGLAHIPAAMHSPLV
jgi:hypothetical protein